MTKSVFSKEYKKFCALLKAERVKARITQAVLSEDLGRAKSFVSKYELGERRLDVIEFLEIAEVVGFDPIAFIKKLQNKK